MSEELHEERSNSLGYEGEEGSSIDGFTQGTDWAASSGGREERITDPGGGFPLPDYIRRRLGLDEYGRSITPLVDRHLRLPSDSAE